MWGYSGRLGNSSLESKGGNDAAAAVDYDNNNNSDNDINDNNNSYNINNNVRKLHHGQPQRESDSLTVT